MKSKNTKTNVNTKQVKKKKPLIKVNISLLLFAIVTTILFGVSLFYSSFFETTFKLKPNLNAISQNALQVHFVDVGQGDAILIKFPNQSTMLIDSGPQSAKESLLYYIDNVFFKNQNKIFNYVLLTHSDADHSGNMVEVLNNYKVINFLRPKIYSEKLETNIEPSFKTVNTQVYDNLIKKLQDIDVNVTFFEGGLTIKEGESVITFFSPNLPKYSDVNNYSPIMVIESYNSKFMLTGDATSLVEQEVLNNYQHDILDVDVLKLGHHGSKTSTSIEFLQVVKPEYAVISVAKNNSYGHPSVEVINNIYEYSLNYNSNLKDNILTTGEKGNIIFYANKNNSINFITIDKVFSYLFISWWQVVIVLVVVTDGFIIVKAIKFKTNKASNI